MKTKLLTLVALASMLTSVAQARVFYTAEFKAKLLHSGRDFDSKQVGKTVKGKIQVSDDGAFPEVEINGRALEASNVSIKRDQRNFSANFSLNTTQLRELLEELNSNSKDARFAKANVLIADSLPTISEEVNFGVTVRCRRVGRGRGSRTICSGKKDSLQLHSNQIPEALHLELHFKDSIKVR